MAGLVKVELGNILVPDGKNESRELYPMSGIYGITDGIFDTMKAYTNRVLDNFHVGVFCDSLISSPIAENEPKDLVYSFPDFKYMISLDKYDKEVVSEVITKNKSILIYRDREEFIDYSNGVFIKPGYLDLFKNSKKPILPMMCNAGLQIQESMDSIGFIDMSELDPYPKTFTDEQLVEINKIFPALFSDSVTKVLSDGSYYTPRSKTVAMPYHTAGSGYRSLLELYNAWSKTTDQGGTLFVKWWRNSLHPLLQRAVRDIVKNINNRNGGTLFVVEYED